MRKIGWLSIFVGVVLAGCGSEPAPASCTRDEDCTVGNVCRAGECVSEPGFDAASSDAGARDGAPNDASVADALSSPDAFRAVDAHADDVALDDAASEEASVDASVDDAPVIDAFAIDAYEIPDARTCLATDPCGGGDDDCDGRLDEDAACMFTRAAGVCREGVCVLDHCDPNFADCDGAPETGCETDLTDPASCGACTTSCETTERCVHYGAPRCDRITSIGVGFSSTCAAFEGGGVACWGVNFVGQLGRAGGASARPAPVEGLETVHVTKLVSSDHRHCALTDAGRILCWGDVRNGSLGRSEYLVSPVPLDGPVPFGAATRWTDLVMADSHTCGVTDLDEVVCWGRNVDGAVDPAATTLGLEIAPTRVAVGARRVVVGQGSTCVLYADRIDCWGNNTLGHLGSGDARSPLTTRRAIRAADGTTLRGDQVARMSLSNFHGCALRTDGRVFCWGANGYGQLGIGPSGGSNQRWTTTNEVPGGPYVSLVTGLDFSCGLRDNANHDIVCWGRRDTRVRDPLAPHFGWGHAPFTLVGFRGASTLFGGATAVCRLGVDGTPSCAGWDRYGNLATGEPLLYPSPTPLVGQLADDVVADSFATCLRDGDEVRCAGVSSWRFPGEGGVASLFVPLSTPFGVEHMAISNNALCLDAIDGIECAGTSPQAGSLLASVFTYQTARGDVGAGLEHQCSRREDLRVECWGSNASGQLGLPRSSVAQSGAPSVIADTEGTARLGVGLRATCVIDVGGRVSCWGQSWVASLFAPETLVSIAGLETGAVDVAVGLDHACAIVEIGGRRELRCWGIAYEGALGVVNTIYGTGNTVVPQPVHGEPVDVEANEERTCATFGPTRALYCWGRNEAGQIGDGTQIEREVPTYTGLDDVIDFDVSFFHTCAITSDRQVHCWGTDVDGVFGNGRSVETEPHTLEGL